MRYGKDFFVDIPSAFYLEYWQGDKSMKVEMDFRDHIPYLYCRRALYIAYGCSSVLANRRDLVLPIR
jgi:hypothetical protein